MWALGKHVGKLERLYCQKAKNPEIYPILSISDEVCIGMGVTDMPRNKEISSIHAQAQLFIMELLCTHSLSSVGWMALVYRKLLNLHTFLHLVLR